MRTIGIEAMSSYAGTARLATASLFEARGLDTSRMANLMMAEKSVALPCEDSLTFAANAALPLLTELDATERASIELLVVATESGLDYSKSSAAWLHGVLGLSTRCRLLEVKQACDAGVTAVRLAISALTTDHGDGARALVVATDVPWVLRGDYIEPSQGAGAVAVLISDEPRVGTLGRRAGVHSFDVADFLRPLPEIYLWDVDLSMLCYLECVKGALDDYAAVTGSTAPLDGFDRFAMHAPFPGMVRGAHRAIARQVGMPARDLASDFERRVAPSLVRPSSVGNIYAATTLLSLESSILDVSSDVPARIGVFSYGSGCSSQWCAVDVAPHAAKSLRPAPLARRVEIDVPTYDHLLDGAGGLAAGVREHRVDLAEFTELIDTARDGRPFLVLAGVEDHRRTYTWIGGDPR